MRAISAVALAALASLVAGEAPKYDEPALHAYSDAALDLKDLLEHVKDATKKVTTGKVKGDEAMKVLSNLQQKTKAKKAMLGMASVNALSMQGAEVEDMKAQRFLEGLHDWKASGKKPIAQPAPAKEEEDLELPDEDDDEQALKKKWKVVDALRSAKSDAESLTQEE